MGLGSVWGLPPVHQCQAREPDRYPGTAFGPAGIVRNVALHRRSVHPSYPREGPYEKTVHPGVFSTISGFGGTSALPREGTTCSVSFVVRREPRQAVSEPTNSSFPTLARWRLQKNNQSMAPLEGSLAVGSSAGEVLPQKSSLSTRMGHGGGLIKPMPHSPAGIWEGLAQAAVKSCPGNPGRNDHALQSRGRRRGGL